MAQHPQHGVAVETRGVERRAQRQARPGQHIDRQRVVRPLDEAQLARLQFAEARGQRGVGGRIVDENEQALEELLAARDLAPTLDVAERGVPVFL